MSRRGWNVSAHGQDGGSEKNGYKRKGKEVSNLGHVSCTLESPEEKGGQGVARPGGYKGQGLTCHNTPQHYKHALPKYHIYIFLIISSPPFRWFEAVKKQQSGLD